MPFSRPPRPESDRLAARLVRTGAHDGQKARTGVRSKRARRVGIGAAFYESWESARRAPAPAQPTPSQPLSPFPLPPLSFLPPPPPSPGSDSPAPGRSTRSWHGSGQSPRAPPSENPAGTAPRSSRMSPSQRFPGPRREPAPRPIGSCGCGQSRTAAVRCTRRRTGTAGRREPRRRPTQKSSPSPRTFCTRETGSGKGGVSLSSIPALDSLPPPLDLVS